MQPITILVSGNFGQSGSLNTNSRYFEGFISLAQVFPLPCFYLTFKEYIYILPERSSGIH